MSFIAKRYAKAIALMDGVDEFYDNLHILASAFTHPKFKALVETREINKEKKFKLIYSIFDNLNPKFSNLLHILINNSRLSYIPEIVKELESQKFFKNNVFLGIVYSNQVLEEMHLKSLEEKLSAKFSVQIKLSNQVAPIDGVKITLEELGYEISFFMKNIQSKLSDFILKTI